MNDDHNLSPEELLVYKVIKHETDRAGGIKQISLKNHPELKGVEPKKIPQIVRKLIKMNLVSRTLIEEGGGRFYILKARELINPENSNTNSSTRQTTDLFASLLTDIPCIRCQHLFLCGLSHTYSPLRCPHITYFILEKSGFISRINKAEFSY